MDVYTTGYGAEVESEEPADVVAPESDFEVEVLSELEVLDEDDPEDVA